MTNYLPDAVFAPGETIAEYLEEKDWNQEEFAERMGYTTKHISQLITGKVSISIDTAQRLERVLGANAQFWLNLETNYRNNLARIEAKNQCAMWTDWLQLLPVKELKSAGILPNETQNKTNKPDFVERCLKFFGVASPEQWQQKYLTMPIAFRRNQNGAADMGAIATWLRLGEIQAEAMDDKVKYDKSKFERALIKIRRLTTLPPQEFDAKLKQLCAESGVAFVMVPAIPKAKVSGVARWLNNHKAMIQLSLYGKTNDKFWFTFFHEAAHILLHADNKEMVYLDNPQDHTNEEREREADQWASQFIIPDAYVAQLQHLHSKQEIIDLATTLGIHPAMVVGRLQHDGIVQFHQFNELKTSFELRP